MIEISEISSIDTVVFDRIFNTAFPELGPHKPWDSLGNNASLEEKKKSLMSLFSASCESPDTKVIVWNKDDTPIHMAVGCISLGDPSYIGWIYAMYGSDANNSKSWFYDAVYVAQTKEYLKEAMGVIGYKVISLTDSTFYTYLKNKPSSTFYDTSEELLEDGMIAEIKYTYL
jgi:hypothetical protein